MEQNQIQRRYDLSEILAILENTPAIVFTRTPSSVSNHSSISSWSNDPSKPSIQTACNRQKRQYCTWCGRGSHAKPNCTDLTVAFKMGVVRTRRGKICLIDGGKIPWPHGEKCLKDWVLRHGRSENLEEYRRAETSLRQEKKPKESKHH